MARIFSGADILLPKKNIDLKKWSVAACDQYTAEPAYWDEVTKFVGKSPSTLHMIYPEAYFKTTDREETIASINKTMNDYLEGGIFDVLENALIYVRRTMNNKTVRSGLLGRVDLECYDYFKGSKAPVRATEGTVLDRIPPRVAIRTGAPLEIPHVMLLADDVENKIFSAVEKAEKRPLYDFDLMQGGNNVKGFLVTEPEAVLAAIDGLYAQKAKENKNPLLFAVGDGNHSLAAAKSMWETIKQGLSQEEQKNHPARFALCELVNIYDEALEFEAIHRVVCGCNPAAVLRSLEKMGATKNDGRGNRVEFFTKNQSGVLFLNNDKPELAIYRLQLMLDECLALEKGELDYIHGAPAVKKLAQNDGAIGFVLGAMEKEALFPTVVSGGALPRKTFSMGEANEKRFYLECRKLRR